jgi:glycyl-tRNA synthetase
VNDQAVTVRHRDTMQQDRIAISQLQDYLQKNLKNFSRA